MKWQIKFNEDITLNFGREVNFQAGVWSDILPVYMADSTIDGMKDLVQNGVYFELKDFSEIVYPSTNENIDYVLGVAYNQLIQFKVQ